MSKATSVYLVMLTVFGAGLWAILSFGSILLHAPEDLAGTWKLFETRPVNDARTTPTKSLTVEQSGLYFKLSFEADRPIAMKLTDETPLRLTGLDRTTIRLTGTNGETVLWNGVAGSDEFEIRMTGPNDGNWIARRIRRAHPRPCRATRIA